VVEGGTVHLAVEGSLGDEVLTLEQDDNNQFFLRSENDGQLVHEFGMPTESLTISLIHRGEVDGPSVDGSTVRVFSDVMLAGVNVTLEARVIEFENVTFVAGDLILRAVDVVVVNGLEDFMVFDPDFNIEGLEALLQEVESLDKTFDDLVQAFDNFVAPTATAGVELSGATITAGHVEISATASVQYTLIDVPDFFGVTDIPLVLVPLNSTATVTVTDTEIESSSGIVLSSDSSVTLNVEARGFSEYTGLDTDAAFAHVTIESTASTVVTGASKLSADAGDVEVLAANTTASKISGDASGAASGAGVVVPPDGYLSQIRQLCDAREQLLDSQQLGSRRA
jgi:hypothetical protein